MKRAFIMMNGFSRSGKSTLAKRIVLKTPELIRIDSDDIHDFLNKTYPVFQDEDSIDGQSYDLRQLTTKRIQITLFSVLLENGKSIIHDSCNLKKETRQKVLDLVKKIDKDIVTIVIQHKIAEKALYKNIAKADKLKWWWTIWLDLYEKIQKPSFEEVSLAESDFLLIHEDNTDEIIKEVKAILKS